VVTSLRCVHMRITKIQKQISSQTVSIVVICIWQMLWFCRETTWIRLFTTFLNMPCTEASTFAGIQRNLIVPYVKKMWVEKQDALLAKYKGKSVILSGKYWKRIFKYFSDLLCWVYSIYNYGTVLIVSGFVLPTILQF
jgi:hypothetical protein